VVKYLFYWQRAQNGKKGCAQAGLGIAAAVKCRRSRFLFPLKEKAETKI
jgi:hypothetical protein